MLKIKMSKKDVYRQFMDEIYPLVIQKYGKNDRIAIRETWNNFTDMLCKEGLISTHQYETWTNPF